MRGGNRLSTERARPLRRDQTEAERRLWYRLNNRQLAGHKFVRQAPIDRYVADFCCREARLIVELDGSQHADNLRDELRDAALAARGFRILRFWNVEVFGNMDGVLETILAALQAAPPPHPRSADAPLASPAGPQAKPSPRTAGRGE
jgi:very-short-patch-repair endonuclease